MIDAGYEMLRLTRWECSLLPQCATMLIYGQLYSYYSMKTLYEVSLFVFCIGSVLSATAPTSTSFIIGRALSGLGAAGILAGMNM